ncbi:MAG: hypothetical protein KDM64_16605, partial [Verrucomicrobiae bacterium]|nr:hypothetical protein [Verrucomicrobiae bacterium]
GRPIPRPFFHQPGANHALIDIFPSRKAIDIEVQWMTTDPLRFTPDLIRAIDTVIRQSPVTPAENHANSDAGCVRFLLSITYHGGTYEVEPALARLQGQSRETVSHQIDRLVARLNTLLRYAGAGRAKVLHGRN